MATAIDVKPSSDRELVLARLIAAPRAKVFRAWAEPALLKQWWAPRPWTTPEAAFDLRSGGVSRVVMRSPEGQDFPYSGVFLEVVPNERIVFTDAFTDAWTPSEKPFFTGIITFEDAGNGKTRYTARARHWTVADRDSHEKMGFHQGWGQCVDQLEAVAAKL
jgi:uncharacterized protein YndB with AHSA1/START domain